MIRNDQTAVRALLAVLIFFQTTQASPGALPPQKPRPRHSQKLPRPVPLGRDLVLQRDAASEELHAVTAGSTPGPADGRIQSRVTLVQAACTVVADGALVRGLEQSDFRLFEDGAAQEIASFDASSAPASVALVIDASPSIFHQLSGMRAAAHALSQNLYAPDEVAVVSFSSEAHLLLPFSTNRTLLDRSIDSKYLAQVENSSESRIYESMFLVAHELFRGRSGRKAIVLLTDGQDSGLGLTWDPASMHPGAGAAGSRLAFDDVARELGADGISLFIVSTENRPQGMTPAWLEAHQEKTLVTPETRKQGFPNYTVYLAELARRVGGRVAFLRETGNLTEIYRQIALAVSTEYTLGYYPSAGTAKPGWRSLRVELGQGLRIPSGAKPACRTSYYVPASQ